jgi:hypothetical protein
MIKAADLRCSRAPITTTAAGPCENHTDRPWLSERACGCGGAGAPCPICNAADAATMPETLEGFQPDAVNKRFGEDR